MNKPDNYRGAIADRLSEAVEYYEKLDGSGEALNFAQSQTLEIRRMFHANDLTKLQSLIHDFRGIDDCQRESGLNPFRWLGTDNPSPSGIIELVGLYR